MTVYVAKSERSLYNPNSRTAYPNMIAARKANYKWCRSNPYTPVYFFTKRDSFSPYAEMTCHVIGNKVKDVSWFRYYGINLLKNPGTSGMSEDAGFVLPSGRLTRTRSFKV